MLVVRRVFVLKIMFDSARRGPYITGYVNGF